MIDTSRNISKMEKFKGLKFEGCVSPGTGMIKEGHFSEL